MEITNSESIALPEALQQKIDAAKNNLTLMEQESVRLNGLKSQMEDQIKDTLQRIADLKSALDTAETNYTSLISEATVKLDKLNTFLADFNV